MSASNKQMAAKQMLKNIETNRTTANNLNDMVFRIKGPFPKSPSEIIMAEPSEKSSTSSKGKAHVGEPSIQKDTIEESIYVPSEFEDRSIPSEATDQMMIDEIIEEPKLSESQLTHINDVIKIIEKQPALQNDIRRTTVEELTKGYIILNNSKSIIKQSKKQV